MKLRASLKMNNWWQSAFAKATARQGMPPEPAGMMPALRRACVKSVQSIGNQGPLGFVGVCWTIFFKKIMKPKMKDGRWKHCEFQ
jgi:hypothetical protein